MPVEDIGDDVTFRLDVGFPADSESMARLLADTDVVARWEERGLLVTSDEAAELVLREEMSERAGVFDDWGETHREFAGVYLDHSDGGQVVVSTTDASTVEELKRIGSEAGLSDEDLLVRLVDNSMRAIANARDSVRKLRGVSGAGIDVEANAVVATVSPAGAEGLPRTVDDIEVIATVGADTDSACSSRVDCEDNIRAGLHVYMDGEGGCTSGFAVGENGSPHEGILTAGHCWYGETGAIENGDRLIGYAHGGSAQGLYDGTLADARRVRIYTPPDIKAWVFVGPNNKNNQITGVRENIHQGDTMCIYARYNQDCGIVEDVGYSYESETCGCDVGGAVRANYDEQDGDSGGPIVGAALNTAAGIHSGGSGGGLSRFSRATLAAGETFTTIRHF